MPPAHVDRRKSKLFSIALTYFFVISAFLLLMSIINLAAPMLVADAAQAHPLATLPFSCIGLLSWGVPIFALVLAIQARSVGFRPWVTRIAYLWIGCFLFRFVIGMVWGLFMFMALFKNGMPANPVAATNAFMQDHLPMVYAVQGLNTVVVLAELALVIHGVRQLGGVHCDPALITRGKAVEEPPALGEKSGWDESSGTPPRQSKPPQA